MDTKNSKPWITIEEAAEYLRCSVRYLREKTANREIPFTMFGGKALFNKVRIDEWLLSIEETDAEDKEIEVQIDTTIRNDCDFNNVLSLIQNLLGFNETFLTRLANNLKKDLETYKDKKLSEKVYAQLSRWCHPNRNSEREKKAKLVVHEISKALFGKVIERTKHPSYLG